MTGFDESARAFHRLASEVFDRIRGADRAAWAELLELHCKGNEALRKEVAALLEYASEEGPLSGAALGPDFKIPDLDTLSREEARSLPTPEYLGSYRVLERIGSGGMGIVYLAEQELTRRRVAVKVLRAAPGGGEVERRFLREARALGRLEHQGVAQVVDAGVVEAWQQNRLFLAMEYVEGLPITRWCRLHGLSTRERLRLLAQVADAVQHAHQRGVMHRDLKPDNILVDDSGRPRVLDFGVARALDDPELEGSDEAGRLIGTPAYMSPEQFDLDPLLLDTRTDVYSLGVVGHVLLDGSLPYDVADRGLDEIADVVRRAAPRPLTDLDRDCGADAQAVLKKAMAKDRDDRYGSAHELAADLRRAADLYPVVAVDPTARYVFGRFVRRRRGLVATLLGVAALLVIAAALVIAFAVHAHTEGRRARVVADFLLDVLASPDPSRSGEAVTVLSLLEGFDEEFPDEIAEWPDVEVEIRSVVARIHRSLGNLDVSVAAWRKAYDRAQRDLAADDRLRRVAMVELARTLMRQNTSESRAESLALLDVALRDLGRWSDPDLWIASRWIGALAGDASDGSHLGRFREIVKDAVDLLGPTHRVTLQCRRTWIQKLRPFDPQAALVEARELLGDCDSLSSARGKLVIRYEVANTLVALYRRAPETALLEEALVLYDDVASERGRLLGPAHPGTRNVRMAQAYAMTLAGRFEEATAQAIEVLELVVRDPETSADVQEVCNLARAMAENLPAASRERVLSALALVPLD